MSLPYQIGDLDGMTPGRGHPGGKDLARDLIARVNDARGSATIAAASASVVVALGADYDGLPVLYSLQGAADATLTSIVSAVWDGSGNLTLTGNAAATANKVVAYQVMAPLPA